ncbi:MAG: DNA-directed RNA polymerase subunit alpha C-terminal domain-containing protein [Chloroflexota bacterium]
MEGKAARESARVSPARPITELELGARPTDALAKAGVKNVGQLLEKLAEGEDVVLAISGFGQKSLIDAKKKLRALGYEFAEAKAAA